MRPFVYALLLVLLTSCGYRTLEGKVKPVYFSADAAVFMDTLFPVQTVLYKSLMGLAHPCLEVVDLLRGESAKALIAEPTIFYKENKEFLVYPGEHIFISAHDSNDYIPSFSTVSKSKVRDGELLVLKTFQQHEKRLEVPRWTEYTFQMVLDAETTLKEKIATAERTSQLLFDSLCTVYQVSRKFKKLTKDFVYNRYDLGVLGLYEAYRDTLLAHHVYWRKIRSLLLGVNAFTKTAQFNLNVKRNTNNLHSALFPLSGIRSMIERQEFQACFDSVTANFYGPARDYLLSRIMYQATVIGFNIPASYRKQYRRYSMNKGYRKIIARAGRAYKLLPTDMPALPNDLLMADGKTKVTLDSVLINHKGKYVLIDLWASWCVPCIKEIPALQKLSRRYPAYKIAFISVSVDASISAWLTRLSQLHGDSLNSYLLLHQARTALAKQIGLTSIPRYLLYDTEGKMINANAPVPSDAELGKLLDKLLLQ